MSKLSLAAEAERFCARDIEEEITANSVFGDGCVKKGADRIGGLELAGHVFDSCQSVSDVKEVEIEHPWFAEASAFSSDNSRPIRASDVFRPRVSVKSVTSNTRRVVRPFTYVGQGAMTAFDVDQVLTVGVVGCDLLPEHARTYESTGHLKAA